MPGSGVDARVARAGRLAVETAAVLRHRAELPLSLLGVVDPQDRGGNHRHVAYLPPVTIS
jgi:hypothetical protein